ncbi:hypothetical protein SRABI05_00626 [Agrobacterium fabrum]|uniref:hypothetical protein n=1 Tax=Agrobacterium fabrum TaxID=1176649 RepID=UPI001DF3DF6C|nr:hypothetical protein [Agrobacterium fabrum]CAH0154368.1 hypothetical protein SRABI05_00626 [Agrobacterium fabrum]CAH0173919.1 hypothetical protein SRABI46_01340 [Agrobacterium fabrum]
MKYTAKSERKRLEVLADFSDIEPPIAGEYGPGSKEMAQDVMVMEICSGHMKNYIMASYSVLTDPELFRLAAIADQAVEELHQKMRNKEQTLRSMSDHV